MHTLAVAANLVIFGAYLAIFWIIARGVVAAGQLGTNRLATATAAIFFSCAVGHGIHATHLLEGGGADWHLTSWDTITAIVAGVYLSLRRQFAVLLEGPAQLFASLERRRLENQLAEAEAIAGLGSFAADLRTGRVERSPQYLALFELTAAEADAGAALDRIHPDDRERVERARTALLEATAEMDETYRIVLPGGRERVLRARGRLEAAAGGAPPRAIGTVLDITDAHRLHAELSAAKGTLEALLAHSPMAIYLKDHDQRFLLANEQTAEIVGVPHGELEGRSLWDLYPREVVAELAAHDEAVALGGAPVEYEETAPHAGDEGRPHVWTAWKFPVLGADGEFVGVGGVSLDVTERRRADRARRAAEERFRVAFEHSAVPMAMADIGPGEDFGRIASANAAYGRLIGREVDEIVGRRFSAWIHPDDIEDTFDAPLARLAAGDAETVEFERRYLHADGHVISTWVSYGCFEDEDGRRIAVGQIIDISERKRFEGQLQHLADHDALTGLFNRRRFETELERVLAHTRRFGGGGAVLVLDLDGFKFVNDSLGHAAGDDLVTRLGGTIRRSLRETDIVARTGGDEFAVVLPRASRAEAELVAEKLLGDIRRSGTVVHGHRHAQVTTSVGITTFGAHDGLVADDLIVEADIAMYDAKAAGKDRYAVYDRDEQRRERIIARQDWLGRLRRAVAEEQFVLHAQPITPICSDGVPRYELLLRLPDGHGDLIPPGTFLYNAERFGLIGEIDRWVMAQAVGMLHRSHAAGHEVALAVNVSARTLNEGGLAEYLASLLARADIPDGRLVVEITETAAIANIEQARELARDVRALGCRLALDDFGAGFATFYYLKHLDFDYVKIDGEFIKRLPESAADQLVVRAVVDIARGLGSDTIAEFVQDDDTLAMLRDLGVGYAQGYHTGRPAPVHELLPVLV